MASNSLCRWRWPETPNPPASTIQVLGLQVLGTKPSYVELGMEARILCMTGKHSARQATFLTLVFRSLGWQIHPGRLLGGVRFWAALRAQNHKGPWSHTPSILGHSYFMGSLEPWVCPPHSSENSEIKTGWSMWEHFGIRGSATALL